MNTFVSKGDGRDYLLIATATFMVFLSHSTNAYLSVILRDIGVGETGIGVILSSPLLPILVGMFLSGHLMERYGPLRVVRAGFFLILLAHLSLQLTIGDFAGVYLSKSFHGFGYGIYMPAGMVYVKGKLRPDRMVAPFGIYSSMIVLPNIVGPWLMETVYGRTGLEGLFLLTAIPAALGGMVSWLPRPGAMPPKGVSHQGYVNFLRAPGLRKLYLAIFIVGMIWGVVPTLMALHLKSSAITMVYYFTPFTAALFAGRFIIIPLLARFPRKLLVAGGLILMGASHLSVVLFRTPQTAILGGTVLGIGYSFEYPTLSVWISERFAPEDRGKPVALLNMVFHTGIFITPLIGGWVTDRFSLGAYLIFLVALAFTTAGGMAFLRNDRLQGG
ncbi:MAG: MFS transporter [bacterium]|nr:MFS transporter [bacterium]